MSALVVVIALLAVIVIGGVVAAAVAGRAISRSAARKNETVPGVAAVVPANWFGSHDPEARLHRRVQSAYEGIQAGVGDDPAMTGALFAAQQQAMHIAEQLVACSHLTSRLKPPLLAELEQAVDKFELIAAQVITRTPTFSVPELSSELDDLGQQLRILEEARAEVEQIDRQQRGGSDA